MKAFMDKDFMLQSATAQHLYHDYAAAMPICDYHCHIPPREIYENRRFENIAQVWLGGRNPDGSYFGDHYKWRVMRSNGVPEEYITGDKPDRERFQKFAEALPMAIGNPMYHWTNLELHVFFGYDGVLNGDTAEEVWNLCNDKLQHDPKLTVRGLIEQCNVAFIGTTDDPIDDLYWHKKIKEDSTIKFTVAPSFRPDKAININKPGFAEYMGKLAAVVGKEKLACIDCVTDALTKRIEFFAEMGCRASDHGLDYIPYREATKEEVNAIYQKVMKGETCTAEEAEKYQTYILIHLGKQYHRLGIAMQIHYNCLRGVNRKMNALLGPDTGYDMINTATCGGEIAQPAERPERHRRVPQDHHLQPEPRRRRTDRHHSGLLPEQRGAGQDPARLRMVVQRPQDRHGRADDPSGKPWPAGQLCGYADRQPQLPELHPSRLLPPHPVQHHRPVGRGRRVSQRREGSGEDRQGYLLRQRKALLQSVRPFPFS